jgi:hypothetical protein
MNRKPSFFAGCFKVVLVFAALWWFLGYGVTHAPAEVVIFGTLLVIAVVVAGVLRRRRQ